MAMTMDDHTHHPSWDRRAPAVMVAEEHIHQSSLGRKGPAAEGYTYRAS
jgi:hypothetical protein